MKSKIYIFGILIVAGFLFLSANKVNAQMMGYPTSSPSNISNSDIQSQQQEEQTGKDLLDKLNNKQITCQQLTNDNFEKIGEYFMGQSISNTSRHIQMNQSIQSMMETQGEEQMHIVIGKQRSGCDTSASYPNLTKGGIPTMMGWGYGNMMGGYGFGLIATLVWLVILIDLVLLGVWLWKHIQKK